MIAVKEYQSGAYVDLDNDSDYFMDRFDKELVQLEALRSICHNNGLFKKQPSVIEALSKRLKKTMNEVDRLE